MHNVLASKLIKDCYGRYMIWAFIDKIGKLQSKEGVLLANKLKSKHTDLTNQKMKKRRLLGHCFIRQNL